MPLTNAETLLGAVVSPAFRAWFGDSKTVDVSGAPRVFYHGSIRWDRDGIRFGDVESFDRMASVKLVRRPISGDVIGSWFSSNPGEHGAGLYAGTVGVIYPVYLAIQNPFIVTDVDAFFSAKEKGKAEQYRETLMSQGYDGVYIPHTNSGRLSEQLAVIAESMSRCKRNTERAMLGRSREQRRQLQARMDLTLLQLEDAASVLRAQLRKNGSTEFDWQDVWIAFHPTQVKSAIGNCGQFDPADPHIAA